MLPFIHQLESAALQIQRERERIVLIGLGESEFGNSSART